MSQDTPVTEDYYVEPARVPLVDFHDVAKRRAAVEQLDAAFQACGFVYITNHTIGQERVDQAFEWASTKNLLS
jgi:isopenicillin N synthase-like dioxygenase